MTLLKKLSCLLLFSSFISSSIFAQVFINEYSASNLESYVDEFGKTEDWIELYNAGQDEVDLTGWFLTDKPYKPNKFPIPAGTVIPGNGHLIFLCSGRNLVGDEIHTNFKLTQTTGSDTIALVDMNDNIVDQQLMQMTLVESSICRETDGGDNWRISTSPTYGTSNNSIFNQYLGYTATPSMDQEAGFYDNSIEVTITNNEPNSVMYYTTDGTAPTENDNVYENPLTIDETTVLKARAFSNDPDVLPGKIDFNTYFIDDGDISLAVFSVAADDVIDLANGQGNLIPIGSIEYFNKDKQREATSYGSLNRHGQDSWALTHRSIDWVSRDEMGYSKAVNAPIFSKRDRTEYQRFMFRNSGDDNYPALQGNDTDQDNNHEGSTHIRDEYVHTLAEEGGMAVDVRTVERIVLFLNGEYWGLYGMRERPVDHDYTEHYYDQDKYNIQYLTTWGDTEAEYGGIQAFYDWEELRDFILENDMGDPENYATVTAQYRVLSLIDYMLVNLNTVAQDWLNYNTGWWRGMDPDGDHKKWGYIVWDMDATFDYYINYTGVPNTDPDAVPCDVENLIGGMENFFGPLSDVTNDGNVGGGGGGGFGDQGNVGAHEKIFDKLLEESDEFSKLYYQRYADVMNTVYSCDNMNATLNRMLAVIYPEMERQIDRWGGTLDEWTDNVNDLRAFINERCTLLDDGLVDCYEVSGPYNITLMTEPINGIAEIDLNTLDVRELPWSGDYFGDVENTAKIRLFDEFEEDYTFSHWESTSGNVLFPSETDTLVSFTLTDNDTLVAVFEETVTPIEEWLLGDEIITNKFDLTVYPNPASDFINVSYYLPDASDVVIELQSVLGNETLRFEQYSGYQTAGKHSHQISLDERIIPGMYFVHIHLDEETIVKKINVIK